MTARAIRRHQWGVSLVELIVFIVIVSVAVVGLLSVLNLTAAKSSDPVLRKQALALAEATMEEVLAKYYKNDAVDSVGCTPTTTPISCRLPTSSTATVAVDRANYNDVDDYNGWDLSPPYQQDGTALTILTGYTVKIDVVADTLNTVAVKKVTVTVTAAGGEAITLVGYRTNHL